MSIDCEVSINILGDEAKTYRYKECILTDTGFGVWRLTGMDGSKWIYSKDGVSSNQAVSLIDSFILDRIRAQLLMQTV